MRIQKGFTLIEILVTVAITGVILSVAYAAFQGIMKSQVKLKGEINMQKNLLFLNEKIGQVIHSGGTLDYEEYYNRKLIGYARDFNGEAPNIYTYSTTSAYGNMTANGRLILHRCTNMNCIVPVFAGQTQPTQLAFGQYQMMSLLFNDLGTAGDYPLPQVLPPVFDPGSTEEREGLPELYLIKKLPDNSYERTYLRHVLIQDPLTTSACNPGTFDHCLGKIQMTKLKSCDNFTAPDTPKPDGIIDSWIPTSEFSEFTTICPITIAEINTILNGLTWIDVSSPDMNILEADFLPHPFKIPTLMASAGERAESPTIDIRLVVKMSETAARRGLISSAENPTKTLMTTYELNER